MKNLVLFLALLSLVSCSNDNSCKSDVTFKFIEANSNENASNLEIFIEGFDYSRFSGGTAYLTSETFRTDENGEITIKGRSRITGWTFEVVSPFYSGKRKYIEAFDCDTSPVIDVTKLSRLSITTFDDPKKNYDKIEVSGILTRASNEEVTLSIGESGTIAVKNEKTIEIVVYYFNNSNVRQVREDFELDIKVGEENCIEIGL